MKKSLKELELSIPTIDIFESRKIIGGYTGWWEGPGGIDNPIMLPEVIVTPGERPDPGYDPKDIYEQNIENENNSEDDRGQENNQLNVKVKDGNCVFGTIATAIQAKTGCTSVAAIQAAEKAFKACGLQQNPNPGQPGIPTLDNGEILKLLNTIGFEVTFGLGQNETSIGKPDLINHFANGGAGIAYYNNDQNVGHLVYIESFDATSNKYYYYDSVKNSYDTIDVNVCGIVLFK